MKMVTWTCFICMMWLDATQMAKLGGIMKLDDPYE
jgi:hypothetical protein